MHYETLFQEIHSELQSAEDTGQAADYIPELAHVKRRLILKFTKKAGESLGFSLKRVIFAVNWKIST